MGLTRWALCALLASAFAPSAPAFTPDYVQAFITASNNPTPRQVAVNTAMQDEPPLETLVASGLIASPYDCFPELRTVCFDVLAGATDGNTVIYEWGEWVDADMDMLAYVSDMMAEAAERGFNLLSNDELAKR